MAMKNAVTESNRLAIALIAALLLILYASSIANFFARAPSPEMSREVPIAEVGWIHPGVIRTHVVTVPAADGHTASVVLVDDQVTRIVDIDVLGTVLGETTLDLDLSDTRRLSGYARAHGRIVLFSRADALTRIDIDTGAGTYQEHVIDAEVMSFRGDGPYLVIEKLEGLYGLNTDRDDGMKLITSGPVMYYEMDASSEDVAVLSASRVPGNLFDLRLVRTNRQFEVERDILLLDDSSDDTFRKPLAVQIEGARITMLFVARDDQYGLNEITAWRVAAGTGESISEFATSVPILNSRYQLLPGEDHTVSFLMRSRTVYGYNLVRVSLSADGAALADYTKTRDLSLQSAVFEIDGYRGLVFSDLGDEGRTVYFASDHPEAMASTTRWAASVLGRAAVVTLTNTLMALFIGAIYLFLISILPYLAVEGLRKVLKAGPYQNYILGGIGAALYTTLKLLVTYFVINRTGNYQFTAPWIGEPPRIYIVLIAMSVLSYALVARFFKNTTRWENPITGPFFRFVLIDSVQYTLVFILYVVTTILIHKI